MKHWLRLIALYVVVASAVALAWMAYSAPLSAGRQAKLIVAFLDIGQGDSIFIQSPTGKQVLIDGGPDRRVLVPLATVMPFFDHSIDVVIATHPDKDHVGGLPYVIEQYDVANIFDPGLESDTQTYQFYKHERDAEVQMGAHYYTARRGQVINLGGGAYLRILYPDVDVTGFKDTNSASVVAQLVYGDTEVMLTGDAPSDVEAHLVAIDSHLASDILKAGHHGSRTATSQTFLDAVHPVYAIISAGKDNSYGHPHKEVIDRLVAASTTILATYQLGTIEFESDGKTIALMR